MTRGYLYKKRAKHLLYKSEADKGFIWYEVHTVNGHITYPTNKVFWKKRTLAIKGSATNGYNLKINVMNDIDIHKKR